MMDRKGLEIVKFLLDWHYLLTEPPVNGSIPEIYFCFVCSIYSKGKDKVSWLQFMKYLKMINSMCGKGTLECVPTNALLIQYDDPFKCFNRITYINRLSLALLLRTSQSLHYQSNASANNMNVSNSNSNENSSLSPPSSADSSKSQNTATSSASNNSSFAPSNYHQNYLDLTTDENNKIVLDDLQLAYQRKSIENYQCDIPTSKEKKFEFLMELIEGEKPIKSENDIYPIKIITNKKLIPKDINDTYTLTTKSNRLEQLEVLLNNQCSSHILQRERARMRTKVLPFYDCCEDNEHAVLLSTLTTFDKNTNYSKLNEEKLKKLVYDNRNTSKFLQLSKCIETKLHFIPIIQSQTDIKLGDCSYLDTCHKMTTCRYIHYGQLMPLKFKFKDKEQDKKIEEEEFEIKENIRIWDFTRGETVCNYLKCEIPAQWINCDLMKIDFEVFGNDFGVVIADPSWTIHMNLNYSSLKDDELLSLNMEKLQKEGLFLLWVTGRTIETGRDFLKKWGYEVVNQITWIKTSQLIRTISTGRTGHWLNHSKEHLLVGTKGAVKWLNKSIDAQILISSTRETSRKPDEIYGIVDRIVGSDSGVRKLEIFGRQHNTRAGWLTVGNQLDGTVLYEKELVERYNRWLRQQG